MPGSEPCEMASGTHYMVLRNIHTAAISAGLQTFREEFHRLFNSYYISLGEEIPAKKLRAPFSRPTLNEILAFRAHVD